MPRGDRRARPHRAPGDRRRRVGQGSARAGGGRARRRACRPRSIATSRAPRSRSGWTPRSATRWTPSTACASRAARCPAAPSCVQTLGAPNGFLADAVAAAAGIDDVLVPERPFDLDDLGTASAGAVGRRPGDRRDVGSRRRRRPRRGGLVGAQRPAGAPDDPRPCPASGDPVRVGPRAGSSCRPRRGQRAGRGRIDLRRADAPTVPSLAVPLRPSAAALRSSTKENPRDARLRPPPVHPRLRSPDVVPDEAVRYRRRADSRGARRACARPSGSSSMDCWPPRSPRPPGRSGRWWTRRTALRPHARPRSAGCRSRCRPRRARCPSSTSSTARISPRHIEAFEPDFVKILARYNPEGDRELNRRQAERLARLSDYLAPRETKYLFELIVPPEPHQLAALESDSERYAIELRPAARGGGHRRAPGGRRRARHLEGRGPRHRRRLQARRGRRPRRRARRRRLRRARCRRRRGDRRALAPPGRDGRRLRRVRDRAHHLLGRAQGLARGRHRPRDARSGRSPTTTAARSSSSRAPRQPPPERCEAAVGNVTGAVCRAAPARPPRGGGGGDRSPRRSRRRASRPQRRRRARRRPRAGPASSGLRRDPR